jgi:hypothetical protein
MRLTMILSVTALAFSTIIAAPPASAQNTSTPSARQPNDGGMLAPPAAAQYDSNGGISAGPANDIYGGTGGGSTSCAQRFRSYDPSSGTYLGFDGVRHPCP